MKKDKKNKEVSVLEDLVLDLEAYQTKLARGQDQWSRRLFLRFILSVLATGILVGYGGYVYLQATKFSNPENLKVYLNELVAKEANQSSYKWTFADVARLKVDPEGDRGTDLDTLIKYQGYPFLASIKNEENPDVINLSYFGALYDQQLDFEFKNYNGVFHMRDRNITGLSDDRVNPSKSHLYEIPYEFYNNLEVGNSVTGEGGESLEKMLRELGQPTEATGHADEKNIRYLLRYKDKDETKPTLYLTFVYQEDGSFLLAKKERF